MAKKNSIPNQKTKGEIYISVDIEADGAAPGIFSMSSLGACVAGKYDGETFTRIDPDSETFYAELKPIVDDFTPAAAAVSGLDRADLIKNGETPEAAMRRFAGWVEKVADGRRAVMVAYPLSYDFQWVYYYGIRFTGACPFGFSSCLDMKTMYHRKANVAMNKVGKRAMPNFLKSTRKHTHNALDDALEQADLFMNLFEWDGKR